MLIPVKFVVMQLFCDWVCEPIAFGQPANFPMPAYNRWTDKTGLSTTFGDRQYRYSTFTIFQLSAPESWVSDALSFIIASFNIVLKVCPSISFHHFQSLSFQFNHVLKGGPTPEQPCPDTWAPDPRLMNSALGWIVLQRNHHIIYNSLVSLNQIWTRGLTIFNSRREAILFW